MKSQKPIFLLADSQLLFYKENNQLFLSKVIGLFCESELDHGLKAAYIGASNNDDPQFYDIFKMAMELVGIKNCRMIMSNATKSDNDFLKMADIILLAGGDSKKGLEILKRNSWGKIIRDKYNSGALLIGISAGAIQLGLMGSEEETNGEIFEGLGLVPYIIDVHSSDEWINLKSLIVSHNCFTGYGIPYGAAIIYSSDTGLEAIRFSCKKIFSYNNKLQEAIIPPVEWLSIYELNAK